MTKPDWVSEQLSRNVLRLKIPAVDRNSYQRHVFLASDPHIDSIYSKRNLLQSHLATAVEYNAPIIITGDIFDAMQSRDDKRRDLDELDPELKHTDYTGGMIRLVAKILSPFAPHIALLSEGNHESSYRKKMGADLLRELIKELNNHHGGKIHYGEYAGYVYYSFISETRNKFIDTVVHHYHHGSGYSKQTGPTRRAAQFPDADICTYGHTHEKWTDYVPRDRVNQQGRRYKEEQLHICLGTYKDEHNDGAKGFAVEKAHRIKSIGGYSVKFNWCREQKRMEYRPIPA